MEGMKIEELRRLAKQEGFSNIEDMKYKGTDEDGCSIYWIAVNNRGTEQTEFKYEVVR